MSGGSSVAVMGPPTWADVDVGAPTDRLVRVARLASHPRRSRVLARRPPVITRPKGTVKGHARVPFDLGITGRGPRARGRAVRGPRGPGSRTPAGRRTGRG